ncbi:hypothetical protein DICVIV_09700 [Dictyocaulus viviparus]|uniref:Malonyl-CoA:ACP transacylase (MAT) domain-containing protein n=1 Tax=Dictyocaulus viviparus TaxID=29172 RepID=A0A0D8XKL1_DICVI|nr:hypothetical protein DICVIV_09700 [Dictyocaulus viviparus]
MHRNRIPFMTLKRWIRKRVALEQSKTSGSGILDEGATFSDVHSVVLDPTSKLPYPQKWEGLHVFCLSEHKAQQPTQILRSFRYRNKKKSTNAIVFDHIPLQEQIVCLFPGQGAQYVGMGSKLVDCAKAKEVFDRSSEILGYDVLKLCMQGPKTKLDQTLYCQPAIFVSSMACVEKFKASDETIADRITDAAGFSVGEFSALVTGGILKFDDALRVVHARAEAMHECNQLVRSGMLTIKVNASSRLGEAMYDAISISRSFCFLS